MTKLQLQCALDMTTEARKRWGTVQRALEVHGPATEEELIIRRKLDRLTVRIGLRYGLQNIKETGLVVSFSANHGGTILYRLKEKEI